MIRAIVRWWRRRRIARAVRRDAADPIRVVLPWESAAGGADEIRIVEQLTEEEKERRVFRALALAAPGNLQRVNPGDLDRIHREHFDASERERDYGGVWSGPGVSPADNPAAFPSLFGGRPGEMTTEGASREEAMREIARLERESEATD